MFILRSTTCTLAVLCAIAGSANAQTSRQNSGKAEVRQGTQTQPPQKPSPQLWKLLSDWERGSAQIKTLQGRHERRIYDDTFKVEKLANGEFYYSGPDKGRIDISKIEITKKMVDARNDPSARVERDASGKPYTLKSDENRRWICDGARLFDIDDQRKEAMVTNLPPESRGANIMNTPLPFLFGLPPERALERYSIKINDINEKSNPPYADLTVHPRWPRDARNWKEARIYLNTENYLPIAVKLIDPAETKRTVYTFRDPKINRRNLPFVGKWWEPKLNGYQVNVTQDVEAPNGQATPKQNPQRPTGAPVLPNVVGVPHDQAVKLLVLAGVPEGNIRKLKAGPAPQANQKYLVSRQNPATGAPVNAKTQVELFIFTAPVQPAAARVARPTR